MNHLTFYLLTFLYTPCLYVNWCVWFVEEEDGKQIPHVLVMALSSNAHLELQALGFFLLTNYVV